MYHVFLQPCWTISLLMEPTRGQMLTAAIVSENLDGKDSECLPDLRPAVCSPFRQVGPGQKLTVFGDLHGQYFDFMNILSSALRTAHIWLLLVPCG